MLYELRIYEAVPGRLPDVHDRFATLTLKVWQRHGIEQVGFWTAEVGTTNELTYLLKWADMAERERKWAAFQKDPEWIEGKARTELDGQIVARIHNSFLNPTPYSALQ